MRGATAGWLLFMAGIDWFGSGMALFMSRVYFFGSGVYFFASGIQKVCQLGTPAPIKYTPEAYKYTPAQIKYTPEAYKYTPAPIKYTPDTYKYTAASYKYTTGPIKYVLGMGKSYGGVVTATPPVILVNQPANQYIPALVRAGRAKCGGVLGAGFEKKVARRGGVNYYRGVPHFFWPCR